MYTRLAAATLLCLPALAGADHAPAPMMAPAATVLSEQRFAEMDEATGRTLPADVIIERFRARHAATAPRLAVFWNAGLPQRVSDWHGRSREVIASDGNLSGTYEGHPVELQGRGRVAVQAEQRTARAGESAADPAVLDLEAGLVGAFGEGGAKVIEQSLAMRLTDNALEDGSFGRLSPDELRLQMRALAAHADYVIELRPGDAVGELPVYRVRILSVRDASVVAAFSSSARPPEDEQAQVWVVGAGGYTRRDRPQTAEATGRELGLHAMQLLSR